MKQQKQKKNSNKKQKKNQAASGGATNNKMSRRDLFTKLQYAGIAAVFLGASGWFVAGEVNSAMQESDLSKLGNGIPTIVQIHDPQCSICAALQSETRDALSEFDDGALQYLVANIKTSSGKQFADKYGVPHVTLLLFDRKGNLRETISGPQKSIDLKNSFQKHLNKFG